MSDESMWIERAQSAEAKIQTLKDAYEPAIERIKEFKANFGIKETSDGSIVIDFEKFAKALGAAQSLELRVVIDEVHNISGASGEKPRMKAVA